jgi:chemotaxis protein CheD
MDIFLGPGDLYFGDRDTRIRTLLGSCVAVTLWHPRALIGGMCHYLIPTRQPGTGHHQLPPHELPLHELSGRYADEALLILMSELAGAATPPHEYVVKIFGGGNQFTGYLSPGLDVASRNVDAGLRLLSHHRLIPTAMHLGGRGHRQVILELWSGDVWLRHVDRQEAPR